MELLQRSIFLEPVPKVGFSEDKVLNLLKAIYGLAESGYYWRRTMAFHIEQDLK